VKNYLLELVLDGELDQGDKDRAVTLATEFEDRSSEPESDEEDSRADQESPVAPKTAAVSAESARRD
jgi:hypothetical protein